MFVEIDIVAPSGVRAYALSSFDDGAGGCFDWELSLGAVAGIYSVEMTGADVTGSASFEAR